MISDCYRDFNQYFSNKSQQSDKSSPICIILLQILIKGKAKTLISFKNVQHELINQQIIIVSLIIKIVEFFCKKIRINLSYFNKIFYQNIFQVKNFLRLELSSRSYFFWEFYIQKFQRFLYQINKQQAIIDMIINNLEAKYIQIRNGRLSDISINNKAVNFTQNDQIRKRKLLIKAMTPNYLYKEDMKYNYSECILYSIYTCKLQINLEYIQNKIIVFFIHYFQLNYEEIFS
ncbi:hypothetical protein TTHERM_001359501 (macronuclear) [Tetrahymena thermophila SB210]|uniref:Uncharacterized protein n=1 Tax=Tetrahymena thermophila (strain SB210) TaxID=312017 RepID=W7XA06_TETTS|nr:hypothetical protein TTHERM_001359501 [Tetrahymena thermophila SB210]EWS73233.1 hypothetical protein TTHERM_001359501 [Tetrahymena thermophila SB210]|eukprot:XP_012654234.1 hypothetical protein TTHERM_001359501 [Tetrahymena thermophila SB210]